MLRPDPTRPSTSEPSCAVRVAQRHRGAPGPRSRRPLAARSPRSASLLGLLGPAGDRRGRGGRPDDGGARPARRATPGSAPGWRSRSTSSTTGRRSTGELRLAGGTQGQTRFGTAVDLPTQSDKTYLLYAQPPAFGSELEVVLASTATRRSPSTKAKFAIHDATQLVVGGRRRAPRRRSSATSTCCPTRTSSRRCVMSIAPEDLPERVEALERARPDRLAGRRRRPADARPSSTRCAAGSPAADGSSSSAGRPARSRWRRSRTRSCPTGRRPRPTCRPRVAGRPPRRAPGRRRPTLPALSGELIDGRALATVGDRVVAAERAYGIGPVTLLGFDPTADWIAETEGGAGPVATAPAGADVGRPGLRRRQHARQRGLAAAVARAAADRRPDRPAGRLHPAHRPDQLPRPAPPRPARVGVADDAAPDRRLHRRRLRVRRRAARQRRDRQRGRDRARRAGRHRRHGARSTSASSRRRAAATRSSVPGRRAPLVADQRRLLRRRRDGDASSTSCRAIRPASATSPSGSGRCARSGRRRRSTVPLIEADLRLEDGRLKGTVRNASDRAPREAGRRARRHRRHAEGPRAGRRGDGRRARSRTTSSASRCRTRSSARSSSATARPDADTAAPLRPPLDRRPADLRPDVRLDRPARRPTGRSSSPGARDDLLPVEIERPGSRAGWATSSTTCRRG